MMMRKFLLLLLASLPAITFAQGFQVNLAGQKQIGMGHTGTGLVQDGASIFLNPGAIVLLPDNVVQAGISPLVFKSAFNPSGSNDVYDSKSKIATPFSAYAVFGPKKAAWVKFGFGIYTPFGGLVDWGSTWEGKYAIESLNLKAINFQPTVSFKLAKFLSIGGGFVYTRGSVDLTRALPLSNLAGADGQAELKGSGNGYGYNLGAFIKTNVGLDIGLNYRSKVTPTIKSGDAVFTVPASVQASFPQPNTFSASLPLPATSSIGLGYHPSQKWLFAADINYVKWDVYKALAFDYAINTPTLQDTYSPRNYKNTFSYRGGAQYSLPEKWAFRAGGGFVTAAAQDGYVTPEVPDAKRYYFSGGVGYKANKNFDVDVSFQFEHLLARTQTNIETQLSGTFKTDVYIPGISLTYHW